MKLLFVNLNWGTSVSKKTLKVHFRVPPLDLLLLADRGRRAGHEVNLLDQYVHRESVASDDFDWIVVTTTPYHMWQCPNAEWDAIVREVARFDARKVVLIGLHASVFPENTLEETGVHAVIRREPEVVFDEFLLNLDWRACAGVSYLDNGYQQNPAPKLPSMDDLVVHDYSLDIAPYSYFLLGKRTGVFEASRGCPWKCTFCNQEMFSWKYRLKNPEVFADEVARAIRATGMETAYFFDLEFTISPKRTHALCEALMEQGVHKKLRWCCQTRADMVDPDTLQQLKKAGCVLIHFGVESGTPHVLANTNKKITRDKIRDGVAMTKRAGLQTACFFMFGLPTETAADFPQTLAFARELNPTYASFHFAVPFPGTPLYQQYLEEYNRSWGEWPSLYFQEWSHQECMQYLSHCYRSFYLFPQRWEVRQFLHRLHNLRDKLAIFRAVQTG